MQTDDEFHNEIIFSHEAHIHVNDLVIKKNLRIWEDETLHAFEEP